jgi:cytochrome c oxidase subunit III
MREPRLAEQFEDLDKQAHAARLGMWAFLASELLLFAGLLGLYAGYRTMYPRDFAAAIGRDNVAIGTSNTVVLLTSSLLVALALHAVREDRPRRAAGLLGLAMGLGLLFLSLKGLEYAEHFREGIFPGVGYRFAAMPAFGARMFFALYFFTTGLHALHVTAGMAAIGVVAFGCLREEYSSANHTVVELVCLYWHFVDILWIFLWPMLYLMHR